MCYVGVDVLHMKRQPVVGIAAVKQKAVSKAWLVVHFLVTLKLRVKICKQTKQGTDSIQ